MDLTKESMKSMTPLGSCNNDQTGAEIPLPFSYEIT